MRIVAVVLLTVACSTEEAIIPTPANPADGIPLSVVMANHGKACTQDSDCPRGMLCTSALVLRSECTLPGFDDGWCSGQFYGVSSSAGPGVWCVPLCSVATGCHNSQCCTPMGPQNVCWECDHP